MDFCGFNEIARWRCRGRGRTVADVEWYCFPRVIDGNASAIGYTNYTVCDFWDKIEDLKLNASLGGNGTSMANATSSGGATGTSTSSAATAAATGEGTIVQTTFSIVSFTTLAVVFSVLLAY